MKGLMKFLFALFIISALNVIVLIKLIPVIFSNMDNGYYDGFSLISVLCGNDPLPFLNASSYDGVSFFFFMIPGIFVSWLAFLALYEVALWEIPLLVFGFSKKNPGVNINAD